MLNMDVDFLPFVYKLQMQSIFQFSDSLREQ